MKTLHRRQFLQASGYLSIGFVLFGCSPEKQDVAEGSPESYAINFPGSPPPAEDRIDAWLHILDDSSIQIRTGRMELGQGLTVVMQQVAGEELTISPEHIQVQLADTALTPNEGYTAGSRGVSRGAMSVRQAAAAARQRLLELAAEQWQVDLAVLTLSNGQVTHSQTGKSISFGELLTNRQLSTTIPEEVILKPKAAYQWVGQSTPHPDIEKIVRGEAVFIQDMRLPGMVHARVVRPPHYQATLESFDKSSIEQMPGVLSVVQDGSFLGVIAAEEYQAIKASEALRKEASWNTGPNFPTINSWSDYLLNQSDVKSSEATYEHQAVYAKPYIMHGSIGPSCAIAVYQQGKLHVWSHSQGVYPLRATISDLTGLAADDIRISGVKGSGCYGHNGADDVAADAALLAMTFPDRPVRLQWQRQDEHQWEPYGTAMRMALSAQLTDGRITAWTYDLWSDAHSTRPRGRAANLIAARYLANPHPFNGSNRVGGGDRNAPPYYNIPNARVNSHYVAGPLRTSALRSLGAYANIFAIESFMEELAEKAGQHPLAFRIAHSSDQRAIAVMERLRNITSDAVTPPDEGMGFGFSRYKNSASYCAVAARVRIDREKRRVVPLEMWAVLDAGETINIDGLKNQTEGGMIQAASWTLREAVQFDRNQITSQDWSSYPILRYDGIPVTRVEIIQRLEEPALGAGEAAQGPAGAAIANAVYAASGRRIRELPIEQHLFSRE